MTEKPNLKYFYVFGALCYPTNDSDDMGKLKPKADIGIFIGYSPAKKAYRIYNRWTRLIMETIHVDFDELTALASKQFDWDILFQPMFNEYFQSSPSVVYRVFPTVAPILADTTGTPSSTSINQDAPTDSNLPTSHETQSSIISEEPSSQESSSNVQPANLPFEHLSRWTKDHPLDNGIVNLSRLVSTRRQLQTYAMWCYFDAFLTSVEPKNYKEALNESSWIEAMQEEIYEFK
ncbi:integrase, catalytic region, zinc finger, CCHC-type containing protein [Tanacetum coccineum]